MAEERAEPNWLTDEEQCLWRTYLSVNRRLTRGMSRTLQRFGLSLHDYEILVHLSEAPERQARMSALADASLQSRSRLSHQISRLEKAGLVRREECVGDRRGMLAVLTEAGWDTMVRVAPHHVDSVRALFFAALDEDREHALHETLRVLEAGLLEGDADGQ